MTEAEILRLCALPAGRELDEAVAEHVLGWKHSPPSAPGRSGTWYDRQGYSFVGLLHWSNDIAAAMHLCSAMGKFGWEATIHLMSETHMVTFDGVDTREAEEAGGRYVDLPRTICRAALKAACYAKEVTA